MKSRFHAIAGAFALMCISTFWMSTFLSELFLSVSAIVAVKGAILKAMCLLIPAMAATGISGNGLAQGRKGRLISTKQRRMRLAAANGLLVLLPCAFALHWMAAALRFDTWFYIIQGVELIAGAANITLLTLNMRDGLRLSGRLRPQRAVAPLA